MLPGKDWRNLQFKEDIVEIAAIVFNNPKIGGLQLEVPTLITKNKAEVLPKTPFWLDYV